MKARYLIDDKTYTVVGINGFRKPGLTRQEAVRLARRMKTQMETAGWAGEVEIYYWDGSLVAWEDKP